MSILSNLKAKSMPWEPIPGTVIQLQALTVEEGLEEVNSLDMLDDPTQLQKALVTMVAKTLKKSVPDATDEEIVGMGLEYFGPLVEMIYKVNNLLPEDASPEKLDKLMKMRQAMLDRKKK